MTPNDAAHDVSEGNLVKQLEYELDHLIEGTFVAGEGYRRNGQLVSLEINPRWVPGDVERGEPEERLDLELLIEPHAPVLETPPAVVKGMFDACKKMMQHKNPRIQTIGKEEKDQLQKLLAGPRLSRSHLSSLTFLLSREAPPSWIHMLPAGSVNTRGRARFENIASDTACELALIEVPGEVKALHKGTTDLAFGRQPDRLQAVLKKPESLRAQVRTRGVRVRPPYSRLSTSSPIDAFPQSFSQKTLAKRSWY